jgi:hypothetical protein
MDNDADTTIEEELIIEYGRKISSDYHVKVM